MWAVEQVSARSDVLRRRSGGQARPRLPYVTSLGSGGQARPAVCYFSRVWWTGPSPLPYAASLGSGGQARPSLYVASLADTRGLCLRDCTQVTKNNSVLAGSVAQSSDIRILRP